GTASGWIHGPFTLAKKTLGPPVTQKRAWMHFLPSYRRVRLLPSIWSTPSTTVGVGGVLLGVSDLAAGATGGGSEAADSNERAPRCASSVRMRAALAARASAGSSRVAACAISARRSLKKRRALAPGGSD